MNNHKIINLAEGVNNNDVVTKSYVDVKTDRFIGTGSNNISNGKVPVYSNNGDLCYFTRFLWSILHSSW